MAGKDAMDITIEIDQVIKRWKKYKTQALATHARAKPCWVIEA